MRYFLQDTEELFVEGRSCYIFGIDASQSSTGTQSSTGSNTLTNTGTQSLTTGSNTSTSDSQGDSQTSSTTLSHGTTSDTQYSSNYGDNVTQTTNSSDPGVIAGLKALVSDALANASNATSNSSGVVQGIFQAAQDSFATTLGVQGGSGLYNSSSTAVQEDNTLARATADAASSVLSYQTSQEQIAEGGLSNLLSALGTSTVNAFTSSFGTNTNVQSTNTSSTTLSDVISNLLTTGSGTNTSTTDTTTAGQQKVTGQSNVATQGVSASEKAGTIICGEMLSAGLMHMREYSTVHRHYARAYSDEGKAAYLFLARPLVRKLRRDKTSRVSRVILSVFTARTNYICNRITGVPVLTPSRKLLGFLATKMIFTICFPVGVFYKFQNRILHSWDADTKLRNR